MRRELSIRTWLIGLVLLTFLPVALLSAGVMAFEYQHGRQQLQSTTRSSARLLADGLDMRLQEVRAALQALAASPDVQGGDLPSFRTQARRLVSILDIVGRIVLLDQTGLLLVDTAQQPGAPLAIGVPHPQIMAAIRDRAPLVTNLPGDDTHDRSIYLAVPAPGETPYVVAAAINLEQLQKTLLTAQFPAGWAAAILDREARVAAITPSNAVQVGDTAPEPLAHAIRTRSEGVVDAPRSATGQPMLAVFHRATFSGYTAAIAISEKEELRALRRSMAIAGGATALLLAGLLVLASFLAQRIGASIGRLAAAARHIGRDYVPGTRRMPFREANQLQLALNMTAAELQAHEQDFDRMTRALHERDTAELEAVLRATSSAVVLADADLHVIGMNALACELFGIAMSDSIGQDLRACLRFRDEALTDRVRKAVPALAVQPDGSTLPVALHLAPFERGGRVVWVATIAAVRRGP